MKLFLNIPRFVISVTFCILIFNCRLVQSQEIELSIPIWAQSTFSTHINSTNNGSSQNLLFSVKLANLNENERFSLEFLDGNNITLTKLGDYVVMKHENGFYYVEEKETKNKITVLAKEVNFSIVVNSQLMKKIKFVKLKYNSNDPSKTNLLQTAEAKIPKYKKQKPSDKN